MVEVQQVATLFAKAQLELISDPRCPVSQTVDAGVRSAPGLSHRAFPHQAHAVTAAAGGTIKGLALARRLGAAESYFAPVELLATTPVGARSGLPQGDHGTIDLSVDFRNWTDWLHRALAHGASMLEGVGIEGVAGDFDPVVLLNSFEGTTEGLFSSEVTEGSLQASRALSMGNASGLLEGTQARTPSTLTEHLFAYLDGSVGGVPAEFFLASLLSCGSSCRA